MVMTKNDVDDIVKLLLINNQKVLVTRNNDILRNSLVYYSQRNADYVIFKALQGYVIASLYFRIGEFSAALKYISKYLKVFPGSFRACKLEGECYGKLNRDADALKSYQNALAAVQKKTKKNNLPCRSEDINEIREMVSSSAIAVHERETTPPRTIEVDDIEETFSTTSETVFSTTNTNNDEPRSKTFKFTVDHISSLDCVTSSQAFSFADFSWRIIVAPKRDRGPSRTFSFYLRCCGDGDRSTSWSCNVDAEFRLLPVNTDQYPYVKKFRAVFSKDDETWGFAAFRSWNEVVSPDGNYMQDDCITVEVQLDVLSRLY